MLFNSWEFIVLLIATVVLYYLPLPGRLARVWQVVLLLVSSAIFYAWEESRLLFLLFGSCLINAIAVERILFWKNIERSEVGPTSSPISRAKRWMACAVALNLGLLCCFKYAGFLANFFPDFLFPEAWKAWFSGIPLPVGISFYTFQGISLIVDAWRGDISEQTSDRLKLRGSGRIASIRDTSFYISFFPQLVAGPIVKAHEFVDQISAKAFRDVNWLVVRRCLISGYFLKIFVADNLAEQTGLLTLGAEHLANNGPLNLLPLLYGYSLQIFSDFAGYSLIAIGLGALFGYKLPENFNFPYLSTSLTEFWRRWHLSLSSWLRDYLYIPLGGNRKGKGRAYFNLFVVMFLGGLWHGAAIKFVAWGCLHGMFLALERFLGRKDGKFSRSIQQQSGMRRPWERFRIFFLGFLTFNVVTFLWLAFMMPDMASVSAFFTGLTSGRMNFSGPPAFSLGFYGSAVILYHVWGWIKEHHSERAAALQRPFPEALVHGVMIFLIVTNPGAPRGFIYFQF